MTDAPSRKQDQFIVRLPDGMRETIKRSAAASNRSMNAEVVHALEFFYFAFDDLDPSRNAELSAALERSLGSTHDREKILIRKALAQLEAELSKIMHEDK